MDIISLFSGITAAVVSSSFAVYTVIKNSQNSQNDDEDTVDEENTDIILVHSSSKSIVHHPDCRFVKLIKNPVYITLNDDNFENLNGCSYCNSIKTLEDYGGKNE